MWQWDSTHTPFPYILQILSGLQDVVECKLIVVCLCERLSTQSSSCTSMRPDVEELVRGFF